MQPSLEHHSRRHFLGRCAALGVAGGALSPVAARAIEPWNKGGAAKFKFSMAAYSYRDFLKAKGENGISLEDFVRTCAELGLEGTELTSYYFPENFDHAYLRQLKGLCFRLGLDVSGTAVGNNFCLPPGEKRQEQIDLVKRWVDNAEILGAPVIRIFSGKPEGGQSREEAHRLAVQGMEECCAYAALHGVYLALENHGGLTDTVESMLTLVRDVQSPWFGVNVDSGNFHSQDIYGDLAKIAPYALNVQIKVSVKPEGGRRQPSDLSKLAAIFREAGYRGYIVLEYEDPEDPRTACPRHVAELRKAFLA